MLLQNQVQHQDSSLNAYFLLFLFFALIKPDYNCRSEKYGRTPQEGA